MPAEIDKKFAEMEAFPLVYVVVLNYNSAQITLDCIDSVLKIDYPNFRVILVDNGSTDGSGEQFKEAVTDPRIELLFKSQNEGYAGGNNRGVEMALLRGADYIFVLNNDTIADPGCVAPVVQFMEEHPRTAICGCRVFNVVGGGPPSGETEREYSLFTGSPALFCDRSDLTVPREVAHIRGTAMFLRAAAIRKVGLFDPNFFLLWEDTDLCYRARAAGYKVCLVPSPGILHLVSQTLRRSRSILLFHAIRNRAWFIRRHGQFRHWVVFTLFSFGYFYPKAIIARLLRGEFEQLGAILKGIWQGHRRYPGPAGPDCAAKSLARLRV